MDTAERRTIDATEVLIDGQGPDTLVMLHGWPDTRRLWDPLVARLSPTHRCVRFTLPGSDRQTGRPALGLEAMIEHIAAIIASVSPQAPVTLILHDWGAFYGYQVAMRHPQRVARVVGLDVGDVPSPEFQQSLSVKARGMILAYQGWLAIAHAIGGRLGDRMTRAMARALRAPAPPQDIHVGMNHPYRAQWTGGFRSARAVRLSMPVLYLYGARKPFMFHSPQWVERLNATPGSAAQAMRTGHWLMVDDPDGVHRTVAQWLAKTRGEGGGP